MSSARFASRTTTGLCAALALLLVAACGGSPASSGSPSAGAAGAGASNAAATSIASSAEAAVVIRFEENAQVELSLSSGRRILIDVWNESALSKPATANDVLLTTHGHNDHYSESFVAAFPGRKLTFETGQIKLDDATITGLAAAHNEGDEFLPSGGTDYIFLIETAGLRIAHFGDLGQKQLTADQLATLGKVDVAFSQLKNSFSDMDDTNRKGFDQMGQVKPRVFVPTHFDLATARMGGQEWKAAYSTKPVTLRASTLPEATTMLFMGTHAADFGKATDATEAVW